MIQLNKSPDCIPCDHFTGNPEAVSRDRIKSVITARFLRSQYPDDTMRGALSDAAIKAIISRVATKIFGKPSYLIYTDSVLDDSDVFNWFINGKHGCKLHRRSIVRSDMEVEAFLRESGVNINHQDEKTGDTPLILASRVRDKEIVKKMVQELVDSGADIHLKNKRRMDAICEITKAIDKAPRIVSSGYCERRNRAVITLLILSLDTASGFPVK